MVNGFVVPRCDIWLPDFAISCVRLTCNAAAQTVGMWPGTGLGKSERMLLKPVAVLCCMNISKSWGWLVPAAKLLTLHFLYSMACTIFTRVVRHPPVGICVWGVLWSKFKTQCIHSICFTRLSPFGFGFLPHYFPSLTQKTDYYYWEVVQEIFALPILCLLAYA